MKKLLLGLGLLALGATAAQAGQSETPFTILVGEPSWLPETQAIAKALDHENALRVMPIVGAGGLRAVEDLEQFSVVNAALITADSAAYIRAQNLGIGENDKLSYITAVKPLPVLLVARRNILNVTALAGKRIATGPAESASFATGELLLGAMEVPFLRVPQAQEKAIEALVQGKADAAIILGTPQNIDRLIANNFHALSLVLPQQLSGTYQPAKLSGKEFPGLISAGQTVDTVSTSLILAVNDSAASADQHKALKAFETELFNQLAATPATPLQEAVSGWTRESNAIALLKTLPLAATITPTGATP
jgi:uncharacterized protein